MKKLALTFAAALMAATAWLAPHTAQAQQKIGFASVEYVLQQMPESKQIESDLKAYGAQMENQLKAKYADYEAKVKKYQGMPANTSQVVKDDLAKEIQAQQQSIQEFQQKAQQDVQQRQQTALRPVLDKIQKTIDAVADENSYAYILNSDSSGSPVLLHGPKENDISDLVLKKMGITPAAPGTSQAPIQQAPRQSPVVPPAPGKTKVKTK